MQLLVAPSWVVDQEGTLFQGKERISQISQETGKVAISENSSMKRLREFAKVLILVTSYKLETRKSQFPVPSRINQFR